MSAARKSLPPPSDDGLAAALRGRYSQQAPQDNALTSSDTSRTSDTSTTSARSARSATAPAAVRRSWYMPATTADALAAAVADIHHETRRPKHEVLAALIAVALEHQEEALQRLDGA